MAEVAVAIANAASSIAIAAAVGAVVGLVYFIYKDLVSYIPYAGSILLGAIFAMIFNPMDPFLGMSLGVTVTMATYLPLKLFVVAKWGGTNDQMPGGVDLALSMKTISQFICAGPAFGLTHAVTKNIPAAVSAGVGAFYLGGKYAWTPIVNFYLEFGLFGNRSCESTDPDTARCVHICDAKRAKEATDNVWNKPPCLGLKNGAVYDWCKRRATWAQGCDWAKDGPDPGAGGPPHNGQQSPPTSASCTAYAPYNVYADPSFGNVCSSGLPFSITACGKTSKGAPVSSSDLTKYLGAGLQFAKNPDGSIQDGLFKVTLPGGKSVTLQQDYICGTVASDTWTCAWKADDPGQTGWLLRAADGGTTTNPILGTYNYVEWDFADPKNASYNKVAGMFQNQKACVPTIIQGDGSASPMNQLDQQPVESDRGKFCKPYDRQAKAPYKSAMVVQYPSTNEFQCRVDDKSAFLPDHGVKWPW